MTVIRYYRDKPGWDSSDIPEPTWHEIETAIRRMDNYCFPWVQLYLGEHDDDERTFSVIGGNGRWALFQMMGEWQYEDPCGSEQETRLWESDQGYFCKESNVLTDIEMVLSLTRVFFETGSYDALRAATETSTETL